MQSSAVTLLYDCICNFGLADDKKKKKKEQKFFQTFEGETQPISRDQNITETLSYFDLVQ